MTSPVRTRPLGSTGLSVTPIGLGLAAIGRPAYINLGRQDDLGSDRSVAALELRSHRLLDVAYDAGIRYFDAARSYGRAEAFLASWLDRRGLSPKTVTISSKWGYVYTGDWRLEAQAHEVKDHSLATLRHQLAETRELLGEHLVLHQIHSATLDSGVLQDRAVLGELAHLRQEGLVVGLTVSGPRQAEAVWRALEVEVEGVNPFGSVQGTWNLLEPSAGHALAEAHAKGWGVIVKESLANGRLTPHNHGTERQLVERVASRYETGIDAVSMAAVLMQPWTDVVLSGAVTERQLRSNLDALTLKLQAEDLAELGRLAEPANRYWATRGALGWS